MIGRFFSLLLLIVVVGGEPVEAAPDGMAQFTRCAACHLSTGAGVPDAFPPLRGQISGFARTTAGREYLVAVVGRGLTGSIAVRGKTFNGFMPAQPLGDAEVAAVLNYVVTTIAGTRPAATSFTAAEVAAIRQRHRSATAQESRTLRPDDLAGAGQ